MFVGRDLWGSSTPTPHSMQGKLQGWFRASLSHILEFARMEVHKPLWVISPGAFTSQNKPAGISHVCNVQPLPLLDSLHISENELIFHFVPFWQWNRARGRLVCSWLNNLCSLSLSLHFVLSSLYPSSWSSAGLLQPVDHVVLSVWSSSNLDMAFQVGSLQCWTDGNKHIPQPLRYAFAMQMCK